MLPLLISVLATTIAGASPDMDDNKAATAAAAPAPDPDDRDQAAHSRRSQGAAADKDDGDEDDDEGRAQPNSAIVVTARRLDAARTQINAGLGSTIYSLTNDTIEDRPGGETGSIAKILMQAPGVTLSGKTLNVRGSKANQVRINNVIVPGALADPADELSSRLAETTRLMTGTLPAQFGFVPAGVISVTTKNGLYQHGGQAEFFAGTDGMLEPALEWAGSAARTSLFATADLERGRTTLAAAQGAPMRDRRLAIGGLGFADHLLDQSDRLSMVFGGLHERHSIGTANADSGTEENSDLYAVGTWQHSNGGFTVQASLFGGSASNNSRFAERTRERRSTFGTQIDATDQLGSDNTLRFGLLAGRATANELDLGGSRSSVGRTAVAIYGQDEWNIGPAITFDPGVRMEWLRGFGSRPTVEPRASIVWQSPAGLTAHVGYARYASAPPLGEPSNSALPDERDDYFDAGLQQQLGPLTLGLDAYRRSARNYLAELRITGSAVPAAFAFAHARIKGVELSATYASGPLSAWANLSVESARAMGIIGGTTLFSPGVIAAASAHWLPLGSERPVTASGGLTWRSGRVSLSVDALASSGAVRTADSAQPNGSRLSPYAVVGVSAIYHTRLAGQPADVRLDLTNLTDSSYETNDATALEGGWTRWGEGRAVIIGIEQGF